MSFELQVKNFLSDFSDSVHFVPQSEKSERFFTWSSKLIFYRNFIWMISSRLAGTFLQKPILDHPTPLSPDLAAEILKKFCQITVYSRCNYYQCHVRAILSEQFCGGNSVCRTGTKNIVLHVSKRFPVLPGA